MEEGEVKTLQMNWILCFDHEISERGGASIPKELLVWVCESETLSQDLPRLMAVIANS